MSRIIGGLSDHFLITEHSFKNKVKFCPEDVSGIEDNALWWDYFDFGEYEMNKNRPKVDIPQYDEDKISIVRNIYLQQAQGKRLVIKNASNILRTDFIKEMFPNALFVFCIRNPWHTLQSMTIKQNRSFLLRTVRINQLDNDLFVRAAASWNESVRLYIQNKNTNWYYVKYEDLLHHTFFTIKKLFSFLEINDQEYIEKATKIPFTNNKNYFYIKKHINRHNNKDKIIQLLEHGCRYFSYSLNIRQNKGNRIVYHLNRLTSKIK